MRDDSRVSAPDSGETLERGGGGGRAADAGTYHGQYDGEVHESVTVYVVTFVASVTDTDPMAMEPLYEAVDPTALELFVSAGRRADSRMQFTFCGCRVTVTAGGEVVVRGQG